MATAYWAGGTSTDTNTAANWVDAANGTHASNPFQRGGVDAVPNSLDDVIIQATSNSNVDRNPTQNAAHTFNSILLESGSQWTADGSNHLTLSGENSNHFAFRIISATYVHSNGTVVINNGGGGITHAAIQAGVATSTTGLYDLTVSGGGTTCEIFNTTTIHRNMEAGGSETVLRGALTVNGSLTVGATLTTIFSSTSHNLTVLGALTNTGTLTLNGSTVNLGSTSAEAGDVTGAGTFNLDTSTINFHTAGGANFIPSTSANFDTNTSTLNLIGLNGSNRAHNFTFASGNMHNITTSRGAGTDTHTDTLNGNCTITGNLTVGANSNFSTGTRVFTVNGDVDVTGQLISNGSDKPMTFKSLTIASAGTYNATSGTTEITGESSGATAQGISGFAWYNLGTFNDNDGTVTIGDGSTAIGDTHIRENRFHHLIINRDASSTNTIWRDTSGSTLTIDGDLTITKGTFFRNTVTDTLTVDGDVSVGATGKLGDGSESGTNEFGSLTIASGGTYIATSGTTTISTGTIDNDGTLTHNKGTIKIDHDNGITLDLTGSDSSVVPVYDLIVDSDNTVGYGACTIGNDLTKKGSGRMRPTGDTGRTIEVIGTLLIEAGTFGRGALDTHTNTFGNVVITGGTIDLTGGGGSGKTIVKGSFRNVGGTVNTP